MSQPMPAADRMVERRPRRWSGAATRPEARAPSTAGAAHPLLRLQAQIGNRAVGSLVNGRVASRWIQRTVDKDSADPSVFNVDAIAYRLTHAIDFGALTQLPEGAKRTALTASVMLQGGPDLVNSPAFSGRVDYEKVAELIENLTPAQARKLEAGYKEMTGVDVRTAVAAHGRLPKVKIAHLTALLDGTVPEPRAAGEGGELAPLTADNTASHVKADAAKIHVLLSDPGDEAKREQVITMLRRPLVEREALIKAYEAVPGTSLEGDLMKLPKPHGLRAVCTAEGNFAGADAIVIEEKRTAIDVIDKALSDPRLDMNPYAPDARKKLLASRRTLTVGMEAVLETTRADALAEQAAAGVTGPAAEEAAQKRIDEVLAMGTKAKDGQPSDTLGDRLAKTTNFDPAFILRFQRGEPAAAAARRLAAANSGKPTSANVVSELRRLRETAEKETDNGIRALAVQTRDTVALSDVERAAIVEDAMGRRADMVDTRASQLIEVFKRQYELLRGDAGTFDELLKDSGSERDRKMAAAMLEKGGKLWETEELLFAVMGDARDFDTVARILQGKSRKQIAAYEGAYLERTGGKQTLFARLKEIVPDSKRVEVLRPFRRNNDLGESTKFTYQEIRFQENNARVNAGLAGVIMDWRGDKVHVNLVKIKELAEVAYRDFHDMWIFSEYRARPGWEEDAKKHAAELDRLWTVINGVREDYDKSAEALNEKLTAALSLVADVAITVFLPAGRLVQFAASLVKNVAFNAVHHGDKYSGSMFLDDLKNSFLSMAGSEVASGAFRTGLGGIKAMVADGLVREGGKLGVPISKEIKALASAGEWVGEQTASTIGGLKATGQDVTWDAYIEGMTQNLATHGLTKGAHAVMNKERNSFAHVDPSSLHPGTSDANTPGKGHDQAHEPDGRTKPEDATTTPVGGMGPHSEPVTGPRHHELPDVIDKAGGWAKAVGKAGDPVGDELVAHRARMAEVLERLGGKASKSASTERGSDLDVSFPDGASMIRAREWLNANQPGWHKFLVGLMVDAKRLKPHEEIVKKLSADEQGALTTRMDDRTHDLVLARDLRYGRTAELDAQLAKLPDARRAAVERLARLDPAQRQAVGDEALLRADRLLAAVDAETDPVKKAKLAEEAALAQRLANAMTDDAYISGVTTDAYVTPDQVKGSYRTGPGETFTRAATPKEMLAKATPQQRQQVLREQVSSLRHLVDEFGGDPAAMLRDYRAMKYLGRALDAIEASGGSGPMVDYLRGLSDLVYKVDRTAHAGGRPDQPVRGKKEHESGARYADPDDVSTAHQMQPEQLDAFLLDAWRMLEQTRCRADPEGTALPTGHVAGQTTKPAPTEANPDATARTDDGLNDVKVVGDEIEVCPVQRCPTLKAVTGNDKSSSVRDKVAKAEKAKREGRADDAAKLGADAVAQSRKSGALNKSARAALEDAKVARATASEAEKRVIDQAVGLVRGGGSADEAQRIIRNAKALAELDGTRAEISARPGSEQAVAILNDFEKGVRLGVFGRADVFRMIDQVRGDLGVSGPGGSLVDQLQARFPDVAEAFAKADKKARKQKAPEDRVPATQRLEAAVAALERAGMGAGGRSAVEALFRPGGRRDVLSQKGLQAGLGVVEGLVERIRRDPELLTPGGVAVEARKARDYARSVIAAFESGQTHDGRKLLHGDDPTLAGLVEKARALDDRFRPTAEPIADLLQVAEVRLSAIDADNALDAAAPRFKAWRGKTSDWVAGQAELEGASTRTREVGASGTVSDSLAKRGGYEHALPTPSDIAKWPTEPRGLAAKLAELLAGFQRSHLVGPGAGTELRSGLVLAPEVVNQVIQNLGIEAFIRPWGRAQVEGQPLDHRVEIRAQVRDIQVPLHDGSTRVITVLAAETYVIHGPEGSYELSFVVNGNDIEITRNTIPRDAPGGDVLADPKKAWKEYQNRKRKTGARR